MLDNDIRARIGCQPMTYRTCWLCGESKRPKGFDRREHEECRSCRHAVRLERDRQRNAARRARAADPLYVLKVRMRTQVYGRTKAYHRDIELVLGYTMSQLMRHLEGKFTPGMTWQRFVRGEIHVDHIVPLHALGTEGRTPGELFDRLWGLDNLQPLWKKENLQKSHKLPDDPPRWYSDHFGGNVRPQCQRPIHNTERNKRCHSKSRWKRSPRAT